MNLEAYIYTNGRSTFQYCLSSIQEQIVLDRIIVFKNQSLLEALNQTLQTTQATHFVKIDDDFVLHPRALEYMWERFQNYGDFKKIGIYCCQLWEDWTYKPIMGVKIYSVDILKQIGGFFSDKYGKVDKLTNSRIEVEGFRIHRDESIVGLHTCGTWEEQLKYEEIWSSQAELNYQKSTHDEMKFYQIPLFQQVQKRITFVENWNTDKKTEFSNWLKSKE